MSSRFGRYWQHICNVRSRSNAHETVKCVFEPKKNISLRITVSYANRKATRRQTKKTNKTTINKETVSKSKPYNFQPKRCATFWLRHL